MVLEAFSRAKYFPKGQYSFRVWYLGFFFFSFFFAVILYNTAISQEEKSPGELPSESKLIHKLSTKCYIWAQPRP